jgi:hypothetical protein
MSIIAAGPPQSWYASASTSWRTETDHILPQQ